MPTKQRFNFNESVGWAAGTVATPVAAAIYDARNISVQHEKTNMIDADARVGQYYPGQPIPGGRWSEADFETFLRGQDTADVPTPEGALFRACGCQETASGTTPNIVYKYTIGNPHLVATTLPGASDPALDPIDLTINHDDLQYILDGCIGNAVVNFTAGQLPYVAWKFRGNCASEGSSSTAGYTETASALSYTQGDMPVPVQNEGPTLLVNTTTTTLTCVKSIELDFGNVINPRECMGGTFGFGQAILTGFKPMLTMVVESDLLATVNPFTDLVAGNKWTVGWVHNTGGGTGNVITGNFIGAPASDPEPTWIAGQMYYTIKLAQYKGSAMPYLAWS